MNTKRSLKNFYDKNPLIIAAMLYFLIAIVFTYPLISNISSEIPQGRGDTFQAMANINSRLANVSDLDFFGKVTFLVKNINVYMPYVILSIIFNKYISYNILLLSSFVLSGVGAYLLSYYFVKNKYASFLTGLIFAFSPFHFYQSTVVNLGTMHQEWIPFLILFLFKFFEKLEFKYFLAVSFFAFLIAMNEHQMLAFCVIFVFMVATYKIAIDRSILKNKKFWIYLACSIGLFTIITFSMFGEMLRVATSDNNFLDPGVNAANKYSMKLLDPFMPPIFHAFWPDASQFLQKIVWGDLNRGSYFIGFSVLGVLVYFGYLLRRKNVIEIKEKIYRNDLYFWSISTLLFYLFTLGNYFSVGKFTIHLPYYLIYKFLPFYKNIRTTGRMFVFVMLGISILFAYGLVQLMKKHPQKKMLLIGFFSVAVLLEFWVAPINLMAVSYSPFYDKISKDSEQYKMIEIPGSTDYEFASYNLFLNTIANKPVLNGMPLARKISKQFAMQQSAPVIKQLLYTIPKGNNPDRENKADIINDFDYAKSNEVLSYYGVRYITIAKNYVDPDVLKLEENFIQAHITYISRFEDEYLIAYEVKQVEPKGFYFDLGDSDQFSKIFNDKSDGKLYRVMGSGATLKFVNISQENQNIKIIVNAKNSNEQLQLSAKSKQISEQTYQLDAILKQYIFEIVLVPGENIVEFKITDTQGEEVLMSNTIKLRQGALISNIEVNTK